MKSGDQVSLVNHIDDSFPARAGDRGVVSREINKYTRTVRWNGKPEEYWHDISNLRLVSPLLLLAEQAE